MSSRKPYPREIELQIRQAACVNAFEGIPTEAITPGLVGEMVDLLKILNASPPTFEIGEKVHALLAKLED